MSVKTLASCVQHVYRYFDTQLLSNEMCGQMEISVFEHTIWLLLKAVCTEDELYVIKKIVRGRSIVGIIRKVIHDLSS